MPTFSSMTTSRGKISRAIDSSSVVAVTMMTRTSEPTSPSRLVLVSDAVSSFWVSPILRDTIMPSREATVMMPKPPTLMPVRMTICP